MTTYEFWQNITMSIRFDYVATNDTRGRGWQLALVVCVCGGDLNPNQMLSMDLIRPFSRSCWGCVLKPTTLYLHTILHHQNSVCVSIYTDRHTDPSSMHQYQMYCLQFNSLSTYKCNVQYVQWTYEKERNWWVVCSVSDHYYMSPPTHYNPVNNRTPLGWKWR